MTHTARHERTLFGVPFLLSTFLLASPAADGQDARAPAAPQQDAVPGLRQPGDDITTELKNPLSTTDEKKKEALAAYMEGVAAQKNGKLDDALKAFGRAAKADPAAPEPVKAHALLLMRLGRARQAEAMARKAIELDPQDYETRMQLAVLLLALQNPVEAIELIEGALESPRLDRNSAEFVTIHAVRGRLYIQARDAAKAAQSYAVILEALETPEDFALDFRQHQKLMTDRATGYETVGKVMLEVGRNDDAIRAFRAIVRVNEDQPGEYHYWLALAQYRSNLLPDSEQSLNRYFESNGRTVDALRLLSDLYNATSRSGEVVERLEQLSEDTNDASVVKLFMGDLLVEKGDGDRAEKVYQDIIATTGDADAYLGLIRVALINRNASEFQQSVHKALRARIQIEELLPLRPLIANDPEFGAQLVNACVESLEDKSAEQHPAATYFYSQLADSDYLNLPEQEGVLLEAALAQNPAPALGIEIMGRLGLNQYMRDEFAKAALTFRRLLTVPGLPTGERIMTLYRLSIAEAENENYGDAITAIEAALQLEPQHPQLTYQLGLIQLQAKDYEKSERTLRSAVKLSEANPQLEGQSRLLLGALLTQIGRNEDAIGVYEELLEMPSVTAEHLRRGRLALSNAYVQKGDMANGEKILEEVYAETPDDPGVNNDLGYLYAEQNKNLDQAEKMIRIAVAAEPENSAYLDSLGWVLYRLGKNQEALETLRKATSDPEYRDSTIIEHLGDVQQALDQQEDARKSWQEALDLENESGTPNEDVVKRLTEKLKTSAAVPETSAAEAN